MRVVIKGGRIIDPANDVDREQDLYIADGKILARGRKPQDFEADQIIDAKGQVVCPGLVDLRARLREPGYENKGTIASETAAAAKGGVTTLCCPPDTDPVIDTAAVVELIHQRAEQAGKAKVVPLGALTQGLKGEQLSEMYALKRAGCVGVSNVHKAMNSLVMRRAMEYAASEGLTVYIHPEDYALSLDGCAHEGVVSVRLGLPGIPEAAETLAVAQALQLIELTDSQVHFCQLSTATAAHMIARAQYDGAPITADVTAHHLFLTEMDIGFFNPQCHVKPPLRTQRDRDGLRDALVNGTISAICSDHQPHEVAAKLAPFPSSEPGISAIETLLPLTLRLVDEGLMSLADAIARVSFFPANILEIPAGTLDTGASADVCIFHPEYEWQFRPEDMVSFGKNTPFANWRLKGRVTHTLLNGEIVYQADEALLLDMQQQSQPLQAADVAPATPPAESPPATDLHEDSADSGDDFWDEAENSDSDVITTATAAANNAPAAATQRAALSESAWGDAVSDDNDTEDNASWDEEIVTEPPQSKSVSAISTSEDSSSEADTVAETQPAKPQAPPSSEYPPTPPTSAPLAALNASVLGAPQQTDTDEGVEQAGDSVSPKLGAGDQQDDSETTAAPVVAQATHDTSEDVARKQSIESAVATENKAGMPEVKTTPANTVAVKNNTATKPSAISDKSTEAESAKTAETASITRSPADIDDPDHW